MNKIELDILIPDLGDFSNVEVIEVLIKPGDSVVVEEPLITIETDKASMEIPATISGKILDVKIEVGDKVNAGDIVCSIFKSKEDSDESDSSQNDSSNLSRIDKEEDNVSFDHFAELVVIGAGPGGYTAAFRAADLGVETILIERHKTLGGVCLNVGCIPSKTLLHAAKVIEDANGMSSHGINFSSPKIDSKLIQDWKNSVVSKLTAGLDSLAAQRKVKIISGNAEFSSSKYLRLDSGETVGFNHCIVSTGS